MDESSMELYISLKQGLEDIENGKTRPFSEALDEIKSRRNRMDEEINHKQKLP